MNLRDVFDDLIRFEVLLWNAIDARLREESGLPLGSLDVMRTIARTSRCRVYDIATALAITVGGTSQAVDRLEKRHLCARRPNPDDRRSSIVELTPEGRELLESALVVRETDEFVWSVSAAGDETAFAAIDAAWTASPERAAAFDGVPQRVAAMDLRIAVPAV